MELKLAVYCKGCTMSQHIYMNNSLPVAGKNTERDRKTHLTIRWLRDRCRCWNFVFFDHGEGYTAPGLLVTDGVQLSQRRRRILAHELAGFIERALN